MTFYAPTIEVARQWMDHCFKNFPARPIRLIPWLDGYKVQVL